MGRQRGQTGVEVRKSIILIKRHKTQKRVENKSKVTSNKIFSVDDDQYKASKKQAKKDSFLRAPKLAKIAERDF